MVDAIQLQQAWEAAESKKVNKAGKRVDLKPDNNFLVRFGECSIGPGKKHPEEWRTYLPFIVLTGENAGNHGMKSDPLVTDTNFSYFKTDLARLGIEIPDLSGFEGEEFLDELGKLVTQISGSGANMTCKKNGDYINLYINWEEDVSDIEDPTSFAEPTVNDLGSMDRDALIAFMKANDVAVPNDSVLDGMDDPDLVEYIEDALS